MEPRAEWTVHLAGPHPTAPQDLDKLYLTFDPAQEQRPLVGDLGATPTLPFCFQTEPLALFQHQHRRKTEEQALYKSVQGPAERHGAPTHSI